MTIEAWITVAVIIIMLIALIKDLFPADVLTFTALSFLTVIGIISPEDALGGFSNKGMFTVALLFPVAYAAQTSGVLDRFASAVIGRAKGGRMALFRVMLPVFGLSTFLNNTPVVAMFIPTVRDWAVRAKMSPSKFLIPVSYASILGGICTLIGTSTNLVANGMLIKSKGLSFNMFDFAYVGLPCAVAGFIFLVFFGRKLLPDNKDMLEDFESDETQFIYEMRVGSDADIIGKSLCDGNLRKLNDIFVTGIFRKNELISPVRPAEIINSGDILLFSGKKDALNLLSSIRGLVPCAEDEYYRKLVNGKNARIAEAVVSVASSVVNKRVKDINFRGRYDAVVLAVKRDGHRLDSGLGGVVLKSGDTVLLLTGADFYKRQDGRDFYLLSKSENVHPYNIKKTYISGISLFGMIVLSAFGVLDIFDGAMIVLGILLLTRTLTASETRQSIEINVLIVIAASFGLGTALEKTGAAAYFAGNIIGATSAYGNIGALAAISFATTVLTELITNNAAVALIFPIAMAIADKAQASPLPFAMAVAIAASASFATPIGYQTNLMVQGPGGYKFSDFIKIGLPLNLLYFVVSVLVIPVFFKF